MKIEPGQIWIDPKPTEGYTIETHGSWRDRELKIVRPTGIREGDWIAVDRQGVEWTIRREHFSSGKVTPEAKH